MELEPAIRNDLVELIAANFKTHEVNELGRLLLGSFDSNEAAGKRSHISLSPGSVPACSSSGAKSAINCRT